MQLFTCNFRCGWGLGSGLGKRNRNRKSVSNTQSHFAHAPAFRFVHFFLRVRFVNFLRSSVIEFELFKCSRHSHRSTHTGRTNQHTTKSLMRKQNIYIISLALSHPLRRSQLTHQRRHERLLVFAVLLLTIFSFSRFHLNHVAF